jgi:hypothetical protein
VGTLIHPITSPATSQLTEFNGTHDQLLSVGAVATKEVGQGSPDSASDVLQDLTDQLQGRSSYPITSGGFGDIWKCELVKLNEIVQVCTTRGNFTDNHAEHEVGRSEDHSCF